MSSLIKLKEFLDFLERRAPLETAESWDNVGLMTGSPEQDITGVLIGLDPTPALIREALKLKINTILTHHPLIFKPLLSINTDTPEGLLLKTALSHDISVISLHTNLDIATGGVNDALADRLDLTDVKVLLPNKDQPDTGFGRIGTISPALNKKSFLEMLTIRLNLPALTIAGSVPDHIDRVAVCGGSGSGLAQKALEKGVQVYITGELKHNVARWAEESGFCVIDAGHYATENVIVPYLAREIKDYFSTVKTDIPVKASEEQKSPYSYYMKN